MRLPRTLAGGDGPALDESTKVIEELEQSVGEMSEILAQLAAASEELAQDINCINDAVARMEHDKQQNAVLVEQAVWAAKSMEQQAWWLLAHLSYFRGDAIERQKSVVKESDTLSGLQECIT